MGEKKTMERLFEELLYDAWGAVYLMGDGFIVPEGVSEDFKDGWLSACEEFRKSGVRKRLLETLDEISSLRRHS